MTRLAAGGATAVPRAARMGAGVAPIAGPLALAAAVRGRRAGAPR